VAQQEEGHGCSWAEQCRQQAGGDIDNQRMGQGQVGVSYRRHRADLNQPTSSLHCWSAYLTANHHRCSLALLRLAAEHIQCCHLLYCLWLLCWHALPGRSWWIWWQLQRQPTMTAPARGLLCTRWTRWGGTAAGTIDPSQPQRCRRAVLCTSFFN
jgi:hypothetical protein